jgi:hypothetical protein
MKFVEGIYGDYDPPLLDSPFALRSWDSICDMTAIALIAMPEGFIIGADGLSRHTSTAIVTTEGQKVFGFSNGRVTLAYAWCGTTVVIDKIGNDYVFFDFSSETAESLKEAKGDDYITFIRSVCRFLQGRLVAAELPSTEDDWSAGYFGKQIPRMIVSGYFGQQPFLASVSVVWNDNGIALSLKWLVPEKKLRAFTGGTGSVSQDMDKKLTRIPTGIEDARNLVHEYIDCCRGETVGGKIHVALVTPDSFSWLDPPSGV